MKAKLAGALAMVVLLHIIAVCSRQASHGTVENGERRIPRIQNAHFYRTKRGLPKVECRPFAAMSAMKKVALNIRHGNRAPIVVRGRESRLQGEGEQFVSQYKK